MEFLLLALGLSCIAHAESVGVEFEYASVTHRANGVLPLPVTEYQALMELVREQFNDPKGKIEIRPFPVQPDLKMVTYTDPKGRVWQAMPEKITATEYDGIEFVSPPSRNETEDLELQSIVRRLEDSGRLTPGFKSSSHLTASVSHLIESDGNCPKLWDLILYIENHWPEIYATLDPERYGTRVNFFAVPLAIDQPELLEEMAKVPVAQRNKKKLKEIFEKYEEKEMALSEGNSRRAWKYRAGNYKKLLGLSGTPELDVVEIRIGDLAAGKDVPAKIKFIRTLVTRGAEAEPGRGFSNPFKGISGANSYTPHGARIESLGKKRFPKFAEQLGLDTSVYRPFFKNECRALEKVGSLK